mgnify:CR=1 FL=1
MDGFVLFIQALVKVVKNFLPAVFFIGIGLPVLAYTEKVDKPKKRTYRR